MVYYFGCFKVPGHHLYGPQGMSVNREERLALKLPWAFGEIDGALCPPSLPTSEEDLAVREQLGAALVHHRGNWSAIAFWDRSGDIRGASNSVFLVKEPDLAFDEICERAKQAFPSIWSRFNFTVFEQLP